MDSSEGYTVTGVELAMLKLKSKWEPNLEFLSFQFSVVLGLVGRGGLHAPRGMVKCLKSFGHPCLQKKKKVVCSQALYHS